MTTLASIHLSTFIKLAHAFARMPRQMKFVIAVGLSVAVGSVSYAAIQTNTVSAIHVPTPPQTICSSKNSKWPAEPGKGTGPYVYWGEEQYSGSLDPFGTCTTGYNNDSTRVELTRTSYRLKYEGGKYGKCHNVKKGIKPPVTTKKIYYKMYAKKNCKNS